MALRQLGGCGHYSLKTYRVGEEQRSSEMKPLLDSDHTRDRLKKNTTHIDIDAKGLF